jgi:hypothetical protein
LAVIHFVVFALKYLESELATVENSSILILFSSFVMKDIWQINLLVIFNRDILSELIITANQTSGL